MIEQRPTRHCGNCGQPVGADDALCPHCDALLAAYEAPSGATTGTSAAITPIDMSPDPPPIDQHLSATSPSPPAVPRTHYESPTAQTLEALDAHKPQAVTASTTFDLPQSSPVAESLERTRVAADLDAQGERPADEDTSDVDKRVAEEQRQLYGMSVKPIREPVANPVTAASTERPRERQSATVERVRAQAEAGWFDEKRDVQQIARQATASSPTRPASRPRQDLTVQPVNPPNPARRRGSSNFGSISFIIVIFIIISRGAGSAGFSGLIIIPIVIVGLIIFMTTVAKRTGRKTTHMPKERDRRK